jgi:hypothetical protein
MDRARGFDPPNLRLSILEGQGAREREEPASEAELAKFKSAVDPEANRKQGDAGWGVGWF